MNNVVQQRIPELTKFLGYPSGICHDMMAYRFGAFESSIFGPRSAWHGYLHLKSDPKFGVTHKRSRRNPLVGFSSNASFRRQFTQTMVRCNKVCFTLPARRMVKRKTREHNITLVLMTRREERTPWIQCPPKSSERATINFCQYSDSDGLSNDLRSSRVHMHSWVTTACACLRLDVFSIARHGIGFLASDGGRRPLGSDAPRIRVRTRWTNEP